MPNKRQQDSFAQRIQDLHVIPTLVRWECGCVGFRVPGYTNAQGFPLGVVINHCSRDDDPVYPDIMCVGNADKIEKDFEELEDAGMAHLLTLLNTQAIEVSIGRAARRMMYLGKIAEGED